MKNIIFIAPPAAGKGTLSSLLKAKYGYMHISTGDLLRDAKNQDNELGRKLVTMLSSGKLVPDEIVLELLEKSLDNRDKGIPFILDGYPRNLSQVDSLLNLFKNDDIDNGIRCKKEYYLNNKLVHEETLFDSRIEYTFISKNMENKEHTCPNCGMHSKLKDFVEGCPYCHTYYNLDYTDKDLGSKYHYDQVLRSNTYRIITGIIDVIISLILSYIYIKTTSRTFNNYDISKIFIYALILSSVLYYFFYIIDAYIVLTPIKNYKDKV